MAENRHSDQGNGAEQVEPQQELETDPPPPPLYAFESSESDDASAVTGAALATVVK